MLIMVTFVTYYIFSYLLDPYAEYWSSYFNEPFWNLAVELLISLVLCVVLAELSIFVNNTLNKSFPWTERPLRRLTYQAVLHIASSVMVLGILIFLLPFIYNEDQTAISAKDITSFSQWLATCIFISLMISAVNTGNYMLASWKKTELEAMEHKLKASEHKQAAAEAELQALKLQLDSHFVFNNLSVLSELILEDQQLGYDYAESFAKVYRYLLVNSKKDLIAVEEELKFLTSYLFLVKNRVGEGVIFEIDIDKSVRELQIPPLTLQLLVENALKHNQTAKTNPLRISIRSGESKELVVSNTKMPLINKAHSAGVGLNNIISRYALLCKTAPLINETINKFIVTVPLI